MTRDAFVIALIDDWAADQIHERYNDDLITVRSGFVIADELERMVRA